MGYQYRGAAPDRKPKPTPEPAKRVTAPPAKVFDPSKCGTYAGYRQHSKLHVPACRPCKDVNAAYQRRIKKASTIGFFNPDKCGTRSNYEAHRRYGIPGCDRCKAANNRRNQILRENRMRTTTATAAELAAAA